MAYYLSGSVNIMFLKGLFQKKDELSTDFVGNLTVFVFFVFGWVIGRLAWGNGPEVRWLGLLVLLPFVWGLAASRLSASMLIFGYFLAGARGLPGGMAVFFGNALPDWVGVVLWALSSLLLALPWLLLWSPDVEARSWRFVVAVCLITLPPLGLIGWTNPLSMAGALFPELGWIGLVLTLGVMAALVRRRFKWIIVLAIISIGGNLMLSPDKIKPPPTWQGKDTFFPRLSSGGGDDAGQILAAMQRVAWVVKYAATIPDSSVRILPETILGSYSGVTALALADVDEALAARGSRLMVGAELPQPDGRYLNAEVVLGARGRDGKLAVQGIPVPVSMWKPWASNGAVANVFGHSGTVEIENLRTGVLICYEQLLTFSILQMMLEKPSILVGAANVWWVSDASVPAIQHQTMGAYARLFGVGLVSAVNY